MTELDSRVAEKYLLTWRIIQPARVQDVVRAYTELWEEEIDDLLRKALYRLHDQMKADGRLIPVRKGTYVLTKEGMVATARLVKKERLLDNARMFLMKKQRKVYRKLARRYG